MLGVILDVVMRWFAKEIERWDVQSCCNELKQWCYDQDMMSITSHEMPGFI